MPKQEPGGTFPEEVKTRALVACKRFCCLCEKASGVQMQCHHIVPVSKGGPDTFDNCIPLCLNCHGVVEAYNDKHPSGNKYRPKELKQRRDAFYKAVQLGPAILREAGIIDADRATFADLQSCLPSYGNIAFARESRFIHIFSESDIKELNAFLYTRNGPEHEFIDEELEVQRKELRSRIVDYVCEIGRNTFSSERHVHLQSIPREWKSDAKLYRDAIVSMQSAADGVCESYDAIIRLGRRKLA